MPLTRINLSIYFNEHVDFQSFSGYAVRGLFYNLINRADPVFASALHNSQRLAPFSVTPVFVEKDGELYTSFRKVERGPAMVSFSVLTLDLTDAMIKLIQEGLSDLTISQHKVMLNSVKIENLEFKSLYDGSKQIESFRTMFISPTFFRLTPRDLLKKYSKDEKKDKFVASPYRFWPLPDPILFFRSAARLWRKFSNFSLDLDRFIEWVELGGVALSGYPDGIRTYRVYEHPTTNKWCVGFVGTVYYSIVRDLYSSENARIVETLLKFSEYANVGGGRTAGMGVIKYQRIQD
ncbi:MAG: CRISPR system precrRNA processing endoribonuclease RAMP protein Cas6 [Nitrososphaeria archaeon]